MNKYENVIIIKANLSKNQLAEVISKIEKKIGEFAKIIQKEDYGIKTLAYEINDNKQGQYLVYQFKIEDDKNKEKELRELEHFYRITDEILRYITVKCEEKR